MSLISSTICAHMCTHTNTMKTQLSKHISNTGLCFFSVAMLKHLDKNQNMVERVYINTQFWVGIIIVGKLRSAWLELKTATTAYPHSRTENTECKHTSRGWLSFLTLMLCRNLRPEGNIAESRWSFYTLIIVLFWGGRDVLDYSH